MPPQAGNWNTVHPIGSGPGPPAFRRGPSSWGLRGVASFCPHPAQSHPPSPAPRCCLPVRALRHTASLPCIPPVMGPAQRSPPQTQNASRWRRIRVVLVAERRSCVPARRPRPARKHYLDQGRVLGPSAAHHQSMAPAGSPARARPDHQARWNRREPTVNDGPPDEARPIRP